MTTLGRLPAGPTLPSNDQTVPQHLDKSTNDPKPGGRFADLFTSLVSASSDEDRRVPDRLDKAGSSRRIKQKQPADFEQAESGLGVPFGVVERFQTPPESSSRRASSPGNSGDSSGKTGDVADGESELKTPLPEALRLAAGRGESLPQSASLSSGKEISAPPEAENKGELKPQIQANTPVALESEEVTQLAAEEADHQDIVNIPRPGPHGHLSTQPDGLTPQSDSPDSRSGTTSAKTLPEMQERANQKDFAGGSWKSASTAEFLVQARHFETHESPQGGNKPQLDAPPLIDLGTGTRLPSKPELTAVAPAEQGRVNRAESVFQTILDYLPTIRHAPGGTINVVLRPDADTEISLRLAATNGTFEASAKCDRGDFALLSSHWPELRASLQQHGVRLLELDHSTNAGPQNSSNFSNSSRQGTFQDRPEPDQFLSTPPNSPAGARHNRGVARAGRAEQTNNLLELWA